MADRWNRVDLPLSEINQEFECRPVPGWPRYFVRTDGTLWSSKSGKWKRLASGKKTVLGYHRLVLRDYGKNRQVFVHALVLEAFVGPRPDGMETRHLNGVRHDNRLENLAYGTAQDNAEDKIRHGTWVHGETVPRVVLTESQVIEIRKELSRGVEQKSLSQKYGVSTGAIYAIRVGRSWKHLLDPAPLDAELSPKN